MFKDSLLLICLLLTFSSCGKIESNDIYSPPSEPSYKTLEDAPYETDGILNGEDVFMFVRELEEHIKERGTITLKLKVDYILKEFSSDEGKTIGKCTVYRDKSVVYLSKEFWDNNGEWNRRSLVWHEMGHCLLGRGHRQYFYQGSWADYDGGIKPLWGDEVKYLNDGVTINPNFRGNWPISLMGTQIVKEEKFKTEFEYYLFELLEGV